MNAQQFMATGDFLFFAREGDAFTVPSAGTTSATAKPGALDTSWIFIGIIEEHDDKASGDKKEEVWQPAGQSGLLIRNRVIVTKVGLEFSFTCAQMSPLAVQAFYKTSVLNSNATPGATQTNFLSTSPPHGWLKIQRYDTYGNECFIADQYGLLEVTGGMKSGDGSLQRPAFNLTAEYSALNTASI